MRPEVKNPLV